jgi:hypothetical protein
MSSEFKMPNVDVRPAVCVTIPEAGAICAVFTLRADELTKMPISGRNLAFPGKWYVASVTVIGMQIKYGNAHGEFSTIAEAERQAEKLAKELGNRIRDAALRRRTAQAGGTKQ